MNADNGLSTTRIILARHGEAIYPDTPGQNAHGGTLTATGRGQAQGLAERLCGEGVSAIVCSELSRAKETAAIVGNALCLHVQPRTGLHEYQVGDEPYGVVAIGQALMAWLAGEKTARILGGESGLDITSRVFPVLEDLVRVHEGHTVLVVIHGGAIIAALGRVAPGHTGLPSDGDPRTLATDLEGGRHFWLTHTSGQWSIGR